MDNIKIMKNIVFGALFLVSASSFASGVIKYKVTQTKYPAQVPAGALLTVNGDFKKIKFQGQETTCNKMDQNQLNKYVQVYSGSAIVSKGLICGGTPFVFLNNDQYTEIPQFALFERI